MSSKAKRAVSLVLLAAMVFGLLALTGCSEEKRVITSASELEIPYDTSKTIYFEIELESGDKMEGELYPTVAPITVRNFVTLCEDGYYDGKAFTYVAQGIYVYCDADAEEKGEEPYYIRGEFSENGWNNTLKHTEGVLSMARGSEDTEFNTAYGAFFVMLDLRSTYNSRYASFGKITAGLQYLREIAKGELAGDGDSGSLTEPVVIKTITILGN